MGSSGERFFAGQTAALRHTFSQDDFNRFAALSEDDNPIHVDPEFSARTRFGKTVAHGMLLYSTLCRLMGTELPGPGTVQIEQELLFPTPTFVGEEINLQVEVTGVQAAIVELSTIITRENGETGLQGGTRVWLPSAGVFPSVPPSPSQNTQKDQVPGGRRVGDERGLALGQSAQVRRTFTLSDLAEYADLTGDTNPILTNLDYAQSMGFDRQILPGGLLGGLFSYLLGTRLPGRGTNWLKQKLIFPAPAYPGDEITAVVEIIRLRPEKDLVNLRTTCTNPAGSIVCAGEALVLVRDLEG